ncbi:DUF4446 family protein [Paenibacillus hexagrammi]|uniref:DUF4446 family protein n=1 Tax=Paenibacillus hexagrammi TaxID=2908839 RepID=A0ABY3SJE1_9BACL|nr:DUF4446 family protein [Paenibacillus sp. YPD9-1]UJF33321.1 DUF4446 family protein [Paenibacillus sp. YPD9-1]
MGETFGIENSLLFAIIGIGLLILLILNLVLWTKLSSLRKQYLLMMNGSKAENIEDLIMDMQSKINTQKAESDSTSATVAAILDQLKSMKSKVGIHRYNAFADSGSDLSFTIAILDEFQDGIIMTGIHSREQTYLYAKPVQKGQSTYTLSPEEKEAINLTAKQQ